MAFNPFPIYYLDLKQFERLDTGDTGDPGLTRLTADLRHILQRMWTDPASLGVL
jgi:hypothetical protein